MRYQAVDNLKIMKKAKNYNNFIAHFVTGLIKKNNYRNILDFGCWDGFFIDIISKKNKNLKISGVDIDENAIEICKSKNIKAYSDIENIKEKYELIYSFNVLEHIQDDVEVLKKLRSKLNDDGKIFLYLPAFNFLFSSLDVKSGHFRRYTKKDIVTKLNSTGFKVEKVKYADFLGMVATLVYILKDKVKSSKGKIGKIQIRIFDFIFPLNLILDKLFSKFIGKNIIVIASKN